MALTGLALLAGCEPAQGAADRAGGPAPWDRPLAERRADPFPRLAGRDPALELAQAPRRVIAGSVFAAEMLLALAPQRLVAIHYLAADPRYSPVAAEAEAFGKLTSGDGEHMVSLGGDLVVTDAFTQASTQQLLESVGAQVLRVGSPSTWEGIRANVRQAGYMLDADAEAEALVAAMDRDLAALRQRVEGLPGLRAMTLTPDLYTLGRGSLFDRIVAAAGLANLAADKGIGPYGKITDEQLIGWQPQVLVLAAVDEPAAEQERERLSSHPVLSHLECVRAGHLVFLPPALLSATSHRAVEAAIQLAETVAPWRR